MQQKKDDSLLSKLKCLDAYPKINEDFFTKTLSGGIITLVSIFIMSLLFLNEVRLHFRTDTAHELLVDTSRGEQIEIKFDMTFPRLPCSWLSLDAMDISGDIHLEVDHDIYKQRLSSNGKPLQEAIKHDLGTTKKKIVPSAIPSSSPPTAANAAANALLSSLARSNATIVADGAAIKSNSSDVINSTSTINTTISPQNSSSAVVILNNQTESSATSNNTTTTALAAECGSCYGAEDFPGDCCNTCEDVRNAYRRRGWALTVHVVQCEHDAYYEAVEAQRGEGCRMWGQLSVNKVAGNFHFAAGRSFQQGMMHVHDMAPFGDSPLDFSHVINHLSFGKTFPGAIHQLDGSSQRSTQAQTKTLGMYQYFIKVVPTEFQPLDGALTKSNQFSVTKNYKEGQGMGRSLPGVFFFYDLSPIKVRIAEKKESKLHFLTNVCAIVGGAFTVAGLVDAAIYQGGKIIRKKIEIGKFS